MADIHEINVGRYQGPSWESDGMPEPIAPDMRALRVGDVSLVGFRDAQHHDEVLASLRSLRKAGIKNIVDQSI